MASNLKKFGAELILGGMILPWAIWVTLGIFASQKADAVSETQVQQLREVMMEVRGDVKSLIKRGK